MFVCLAVDAHRCNKKENIPMKWITREHVKVDRVACPWLIRKFVDPDAGDDTRRRSPDRRSHSRARVLFVSRARAAQGAGRSPRRGAIEARVGRVAARARPPAGDRNRTGGQALRPAHPGHRGRRPCVPGARHRAAAQHPRGRGGCTRLLMAAALARRKRGANNRACARNYLISNGLIFDGVKVGSKLASQAHPWGSLLVYGVTRLASPPDRLRCLLARDCREITTAFSSPARTTERMWR